MVVAYINNITSKIFSFLFDMYVKWNNWAFPVHVQCWQNQTNKNKIWTLTFSHGTIEERYLELCRMLLPIEFFTFLPVSITLTHFQGHRIVWRKKEKRKFYYCLFYLQVCWAFAVLFSDKIRDLMKQAAAVLFPNFYAGDRGLHDQVGATVFHSGGWRRCSGFQITEQCGWSDGRWHPLPCWGVHVLLLLIAFI